MSVWVWSGAHFHVAVSVFSLPVLFCDEDWKQAWVLKVSQWLEDWKLMSGVGTQYALNVLNMSQATFRLCRCFAEGKVGSHHARVRSPNSQTSHVQNGSAGIFVYALSRIVGALHTAKPGFPPGDPNVYGLHSLQTPADIATLVVNDSFTSTNYPHILINEN